MMKSILRTAVATSLAVMAAGAAFAYPDKPIKVVVPFGAGGTSDVFSRLVAEKLQGELGQPLAVINVPGGGSVIGNRQVKDAPADGYTVLHVNVGIHTSAALGQADFTYEDLETVACGGALQTAIFVHKDSRWETLTDLLDEAKEKPDSIIFAANLGAAAHFAALVLTDAYEGAELRYVQIGGGAKILTSMLGRESDVAILDNSSLLPYRESGEFRILAVLSGERSPDFPDVPTAVEQGVDATFDINYCWYMPKGTPADVVEIYRDTLERVFASDELKAELADRSIAPFFYRDAAADELNDKTLATLTKIAEELGMRK